MYDKARDSSYGKVLHSQATAQERRKAMQRYQVQQPATDSVWIVNAESQMDACRVVAEEECMSSEERAGLVAVAF